MPEIAYAARVPAWQRMLIVLVMVVIIVIAAMVQLSDVIEIEILGLFIQICGLLLLTLGLVKTNDDLLMIAQHPKSKDTQQLVTHLATERFQVMLALFLVVLGLLLEIVGMLF